MTGYFCPIVRNYRSGRTELADQVTVGALEKLSGFFSVAQIEQAIDDAF